MKIEKVKIDKIKEYENNPRVHSPRQIEQIKKSIKQFGFKIPLLLDSKLTIIAGHGRMEAAKLLKLKEVPAIICKDLTTEKSNALRILDNQITLNSSWNETALFEEIKKINLPDINLEDFDLPNLEDLGYSPEEVKKEAEQYRLIIYFNKKDYNWVINKYKTTEKHFPNVIKDILLKK